MENSEQTLVEHLTDLRKVLIRSLIFFLLCFIICLVFINRLIPLLANHYELVMLGPLDVIRLYTGIAGSLSLGVSLPFIAFQAWLFIKPALSDKEAKMSVLFFPAILLSFVVGLLFGLFIVFPTIYGFLMKLGETNFAMMITAREYFSFLLMSTIPFGFLFEVPLLLVFLTSIGVVTPDMLRSIRKYAYLVLAVVSALITPPDFFSQILVMIPLIGLYELGILLSRISFKKRVAVQQDIQPNDA
ncbi:twin-arginine translocase subunit TatC [Cytobacillus purgationiresistens]|uniref:Sec-independent protein translocase protein TatC n=1 Tax=Cytobacillus purgationiresistens TaxID=863449 RepID=A0ABU0AJS9_9BACI|nr:twin-arginine translocase subunit TatC [Cytobacillus purgationiresistens]MDQ0271526.1 sec-independent protein translocase protein TatC [Cytobacillus purgationiresistens]